MGSYVTAKWGQLGLIRVLQQETRDVPGISVSAVQPGGVDTPIYFQARPGPAAPAARRRRSTRRSGWRAPCCRTLDRPRRIVQAGLFNPLITAGFRLAPGVFDVLVGPLLQRMAIANDDVAADRGQRLRVQAGGQRDRGALAQHLTGRAAGVATLTPAPQAWERRGRGVRLTPW